jgi:hypothetical protein
MGCEDRIWMEVAQNRVKWRAILLSVLNLRVVLPELLRPIYFYVEALIHDPQ